MSGPSTLYIRTNDHVHKMDLSIPKITGALHDFSIELMDAPYYDRDDQWIVLRFKTEDDANYAKELVRTAKITEFRLVNDKGENLLKEEKQQEEEEKGQQEQQPKEEQSFIDIWKNQRGSFLVLETKDEDDSLKGIYYTAVGKGVGDPWPLVGWKNGDLVAFTTNYEKSIASWTGDYSDSSISTTWMLKSQLENAQDFKSLSLGSDQFERQNFGRIASKIVKHHYKVIGSTMVPAGNLLHGKIADDTAELFIADEQTNGRGQGTNRWVSPTGSFYGTYVIKASDGLQPPNSGLLPHVCSLSVAETLIQFKVPGVEVKYINDVFVNDFKVSGNLCQSEWAGRATKFSLGIGVNLNTEKAKYVDVPNGSSVFGETGIAIDIEHFTRALSFTLIKNLQILATEGFASLHKKLLPMLRLLGEKVNMYEVSDIGLSDVKFTGIFKELGLDGNAKIEQENGELVSLDKYRMRKSCAVAGCDGGIAEFSCKSHESTLVCLTHKDGNHGNHQ